jgi:DNA-binding transcriptional ArsR family regulator
MLARARVLCSPTRLNLWFSLGEDGMRPSELARMHGVAASTVTHHMHVLRREKLVELVGAGAHRVYRWTGTELVIATREELEAAVQAEAETRPDDPTRIA